MKTKDYEPYEYLNDNGFFNNDYQFETVVVPVESKNEVSYCESAALSNMDKSKLRKQGGFLYWLWQIADFNLGMLILGISLIMPLIYIDGFKCAEYGPAIFGVVTHILTSIYGIILMTGRIIAGPLFAKSKGLHSEQTLYTLNFNYDIIPVKLYDITWDDKKEAIFHCTTLIGIEDDSRQKYISLKEGELFLTPEQASHFISLIHSQRIAALTDWLNDKTEAFLTGRLFQKYSVLYYEQNNIYTWYPTPDHLSVNDFLMNKQSLISFCNFIRATKAEEEKAIQKQEAQDKEDNSLIGDILESVQKDLMDSI